MTSNNDRNRDDSGPESLEDLAQMIAELSPKKQKALRLQLEGTHSKQEICQEVDIDESTFWRWRHQDVAYRTALREARQFLWEQHLDQLCTLDGIAIETLKEGVAKDRDLAFDYLKARPLLGARPPSSPTHPLAMAERMNRKQKVRQLSLLVHGTDDGPRRGPGHPGRHPGRRANPREGTTPSLRGRTTAPRGRADTLTR